MKNGIDIKSLNCDEQSPIFIGGPKRSGTTLLRKILGAHSQVTFSPPDFLFHLVYSHLYSYGDLSHESNMIKMITDCIESPLVKEYFGISMTPKEILTILPENSFRAVYTALNYLYMKESLTQYWGSKTPCNVFWLKEIHRMFPKARFILIYRDGRDVSIDQLGVNWGGNNLYTASLSWQSYIKAMLESKKYLEQYCYCEIYYEDLVRQPKKEITKICDFINIAFEPEMLRWYAKAGDSFSSSQSYHQITNQPITEEFVGMYKSLPGEDRRLLVSIIGDTLRKIGYPVEMEAREIGFWEREWYQEEDRHGGLMLIGGPEYKCKARNEREERRKKKVWSYEDRAKQYGIVQ